MESQHGVELVVCQTRAQPWKPMGGDSNGKQFFQHLKYLKEAIRVAIS